jgi:hypothetical protein
VTVSGVDLMLITLFSQLAPVRLPSGRAFRFYFNGEEENMDSTTVLIIIIVILLVGGGGWYGRGRWF